MRKSVAAPGASRLSISCADCVMLPLQNRAAHRELKKETSDAVPQLACYVSEQTQEVMTIIDWEPHAVNVKLSNPLLKTNFPMRHNSRHY